MLHASRFTFHDSGFTVIEIAVVAAVAVIIAVVVGTSLYSRRSRMELDNAAKEVAAILREAQSRSINQEDNAVWGVHFENSTSVRPFFVLFKNSYSTSTTVTYRALPSRVVFDSSFLGSGSSIDITFAKTTGLPSTSTSIGLQLTTPGASASPESVSRETSGKIFFDDFNRGNL